MELKFLIIRVAFQLDGNKQFFDIAEQLNFLKYKQTQ